MSPLEISDNIYWVGAVDWGLRDFHGYSLARKGTTYNAFLIRDQKPTLVDTVASRVRDQFMANVRELVDLQKIQYLVINHVEPDHSGCLEEIVEKARPQKIFCSRMGRDFMIGLYHREEWPYQVVKTGDEVNLGQKTIQFIELPMLHWPDNMGCFVKQNGIFISSDAFGHNWATSERFDDQVDHRELYFQLGHYFANIILPFSANVLKALKTIKDLGWNIKMIAPDHGVVIRSGVDRVLGLYEKWAQGRTEKKAVIAFDTMWGSTRTMAEAIGDGLAGQGIQIRILPLKSCHHSDVMAEVLDSRAVVLGSATHNNGVLPLMAALLRYMAGLRPGGRIGASFGSYGWSGEAPARIREALENMKITPVQSLRVKHVPRLKDLKACKELGRNLAAAICEAG